MSIVTEVQPRGFRRGASLRLTVFAGICAALVPVAAGAQDIPDEELVDLGTAGGDESVALQVNGDGSTVYGFAQDDSGAIRMVLWRNGVIEDITVPGSNYGPANLSNQGGLRGLMSRDGSTIAITDTGMARLGVYRYRDGIATRIDEPSAPGALTIFLVYGIDHDGSTLVGIGYVGPYQHAVRWTEEGVEDLGLLGGVASVALAVSGDGSIVVGTSDVDGGGREAFRWSGGTMQSLGTLPGQLEGSASLISDDGSIIAGFARVMEGTFFRNRVFIWEDGAMTDIGDLGNRDVYATAISADGSTIIGNTQPTNPDVQQTTQAFYWRDGVMREVGYLPSDTPGQAFTRAYALSGDGSVIVGGARAAFGEPSLAYRWTEETGLVPLGTLGGAQSRALDISEDGSTIVGYSENAQGQVRAFIYRTAMQDFTNMLASFSGLAEEAELAVELQQRFTQLIAAPGCHPGEERLCIGAEALGLVTAQSTLAGRRGTAGARVFGRLAVAKDLSIGGSYVFADPTIRGDRTRESGSRAWAVSLDYGGAATGLSGRAWYARAHENLALDRGAEFADVEVMTGRTRLVSESYGVRAGYGLAIGESTVLRPWAEIARYRSTRDGFAEEGVDFPASFAGFAAHRTLAEVGADLVLPLGDNHLVLTGAVEADLDADPVAFAGTSEIPGMEAFTLTSGLARKNTRARLGAGYAIPVGPLAIGVRVGARSPVYGSAWQLDGGLSLTGAF